MTSSAELIWLSSVIEGDGCISILRFHKSHNSIGYMSNMRKFIYVNK